MQKGWTDSTDAASLASLLAFVQETPGRGAAKAAGGDSDGRVDGERGLAHQLSPHPAGGGQALVMEISTTFGVYMILVGALVLVYGSITYFRPP